MSNEFPFLKNLRKELMVRASETLEPDQVRGAARALRLRGWMVAGVTFAVVVAVGAGWGLLLARWRNSEAPIVYPEISNGASTSVPAVSQGGGDAEVPLCGSLAWPTAPDSWYRAEPVYDDATTPIDAVERFAATLEGFERIWADSSRNGWVTVGFVDSDVVERQRQLEGAFPDAGVVAVEMDHSVSELEVLSRQIASELPDGMTPYRVYESEGYVGVWIGVLTPQSRASLSDIAKGRPICADGYHPDEVVQAGPQAEEGDGWRHLGNYETSIGREPRVVTTESGLRDVLSSLGATGLPGVDFDTEIVVTFEVGTGSNCATRFDGFVATADLLYATIVDPSVGIEPPQPCTLDYLARTYVIAIDRDRLPSPPFSIRAGSNYSAETRVVIDLREPNAVIAD